MKPYKITWQGPMLPDYFQGAGTSFTPWNDVSTGCGSTLREAYEDAVEFACQSEYPYPELPEFAATGLPDESVPEEYEESLLYVVIHYNQREA